MTKFHTLSTLFNGNGAPPSPWTTDHGGGGGVPVQGGGVLAFPGVLLGGDDSELAWSGDLDLSNDRLLLQFAAIIGRPGTVELDLYFASSWSFAMQLRNGSWTIQLYHSGSHYDLYVGAAADLDARAWSLSYDPSHTLHAFAGPDPWRMVEIGSDGNLPLASAQHVTSLTLDSKNLESNDLAYGQTQLIGFNAWNLPAFALTVPTALPCDVCGKLDTIIGCVQHSYYT